MNDYEKESRPGVAAPERPVETGTVDEAATISINQHTTEEVSRQTGLVHKFLATGKANAVPGRDLVKLLQLNDLRDLTQLIERERRDGFPICASTGSEKGYYLASDADELEESIASLNRRLRNVGRTMTHLEDTLVRMTGQEKIEGC